MVIKYNANNHNAWNQIQKPTWSANIEVADRTSDNSVVPSEVFLKSWTAKLCITSYSMYIDTWVYTMEFISLEIKKVCIVIEQQWMVRWAWLLEHSQIETVGDTSMWLFDLLGRLYLVLLITHSLATPNLN